MKSVIKKELMYSLIIPYIIIGVMAITLFGGVQISVFFNMKERIVSEEVELVQGLTREMDYLISDIQRLVIDFESNQGLWKLRSINKQMDATDKYNISVGINKLKKVNTYNRFIKQAYIYYQQGDFITSGGNYYKNNVAYEKFHELEGITFDKWYQMVTADYAQGALQRMGEELCYIVTTSPTDEKDRCNIIIMINEENLVELINTYNSMEGQFFIMNHDKQVIVTNDDGQGNSFLDRINQSGKPRYLYENETGTTCLETKIGNKKFIVLQDSIQRIKSSYIVVIPQKVFMRDMNNSVLLVVLAITFFVTLLVSGIYIIHKKYKVVDELIQRLKETYDFNEFKDGTYSEMEYIENVLDNLKEAVKAQKGLVLEGVLRKSLQGILEADEEVYTYLECNGENFSNNYFVTAIIEETKEIQKVKHKKLNEFIINNTLEETFEGEAKPYTMTLNDCYIVVISVKEAISEEKLKEIIKRFKALKNYWEDKFEFKSTMSLSKPYRGLSNTFLAYKEVKKSLEYKIFFGEDEIIYQPEIGQAHEGYEYNLEIEAQLVNYIKLSESQKAIETVDRLFAVNIEKNNLSVEGVKYLVMELGLTLDRLSKEMKYDMKLISREFFEKYETIDEIRQTVNEMVDKMCLKVESQKKGMSKVERIIKYIHDNYQDSNLNVSSIADAFEMNSSYLSRVFKEQTGENLLSFINQYRVEKIKILLVQTSLTLEEIGKRVGFINSVAVIRAFKKCEGVTPTQYKNIHSE